MEHSTNHPRLGKFGRIVGEDKKEERNEEMINKKKLIQKLIISLTVLSFYGFIDLCTVQASDQENIVDPLDPSKKAEPVFPPRQAKKRKNEQELSEESLISLPDGKKPIKIVKPSKKKREKQENSYNHLPQQFNVETIFPDGIEPGEGKEDDLYLSEVYIQLSGTILFGR